MLDFEGRASRHARIFRKEASIIFVFVGVLLMLTGISDDSWTREEFGVHNYKDGTVYRGLWSTYVTNNYGQTVTFRNRRSDYNGANWDPFCGSGAVETPLASTFEYLFPGNDSVPEEVCCGPNAVFQATRHDDAWQWCRLRPALKTFSIISVIASLFAFMASIYAAKAPSTLPFVLTSLFTALMAFVNTVLFGVFLHTYKYYWMHEADAELVEVNGSFSIIIYIIGWLCVGIGGGAELFAACSPHWNASNASVIVATSTTSTNEKLPTYNETSKVMPA